MGATVAFENQRKTCWLKPSSKASKRRLIMLNCPIWLSCFNATDECSAEFQCIWGVPSRFRSLIWRMDCYQSFSTSASQSVTRPLAFRARGNEKGERPTLGWNVGMAPSIITTKLQPNLCNLFPPICTSPAAIRPRKGETAKTKTWLWQLKTFFCAPVSMSQTVTFQSFPEKMSSRCWCRTLGSEKWETKALMMKQGKGEMLRFSQIKISVIWDNFIHIVCPSWTSRNSVMLRPPNPPSREP